MKQFFGLKRVDVEMIAVGYMLANYNTSTKYRLCLSDFHNMRLRGVYKYLIGKKGKNGRLDSETLLTGNVNSDRFLLNLMLNANDESKLMFDLAVRFLIDEE